MTTNNDKTEDPSAFRRTIYIARRCARNITTNSPFSFLTRGKISRGQQQNTGMFGLTAFPFARWSNSIQFNWSSSSQ
jgi:hypothetical protein